jgi:hypothetical protein
MGKADVANDKRQKAGKWWAGGLTASIIFLIGFSIRLLDDGPGHMSSASLLWQAVTVMGIGLIFGSLGGFIVRRKGTVASAILGGVFGVGVPLALFFVINAAYLIWALWSGNYQ